MYTERDLLRIRGKEMTASAALVLGGIGLLGTISLYLGAKEAQQQFDQQTRTELQRIGLASCDETETATDLCFVNISASTHTVEVKLPGDTTHQTLFCNFAQSDDTRNGCFTSIEPTKTQPHRGKVIDLATLTPKQNS